jgi:hypothetical protein
MLSRLAHSALFPSVHTITSGTAGQRQCEAASTLVRRSDAIAQLSDDKVVRM